MTDPEYFVQNIELDRIFNDTNFNCRGAILPMDVIDLAKDIEANNLQFPIAVQPWDGDHDFRIVAGHRRYVAFKVLKRKTIPAMVKTNLSEVAARLLNLSENLKRENLNILQEANAVQNLQLLGLTQGHVSEQLGMSRSWVQVRVALLDLPLDIQKEASLGHLNQYQIKSLAALSSNEQRYEAVRKIKTARLNGERGVEVTKVVDLPNSKKRRSKHTVQEMIDHLVKEVGYGLHTRVLAWANGNICTTELYFDIKRFAKTKGIEYIIPNIGEKK